MPNTYSRAWQEYRRREIFLISSVVGFVSVPFLIGALTHEGYWPDLIIGLLIPVLLLFAFVSGLRLVTWPCPRCGKTFRGLSNSCFHCGLPIWSEDD
jgi:hypothetical protein